jgi:hypothetical protein
VLRVPPKEEAPRLYPSSIQSGWRGPTTPASIAGAWNMSRPGPIRAAFVHQRPASAVESSTPYAQNVRCKAHCCQSGYTFELVTWQILAPLSPRDVLRIAAEKGFANERAEGQKAGDLIGSGAGDGKDGATSAGGQQRPRNDGGSEGENRALAAIKLHLSELPEVEKPAE